MYKVFLVDDEVVIREGIRNNFSWDETEFVLCGEAPDGEMALSMMVDLKPDILVTDIRMPFMDGLSLARQVAQSMPWIHTVILSGYDDFEYAQRAISLGVKEYLLKPVTAKKLGEVLARIAEKIKQEREQQANMDVLRMQLASASRFAREQLLAHLLEGGDTAALVAEGQKLGLDLKARHYLVMLLGEVADERRLALQAAMHRLAQTSGGAVHQTTAEGKLALLIMGDGKEDIEEYAYTLAMALTHEVGDEALPAVAISAPVTHLAELKQALASAKAVLRSMDGQAQRIMGAMDVDLSASVELMEGELLPLNEKLRYAAVEEGEAVVQRYFDSLGEMAAQSVLIMNYMLMDVLLAATHMIKQCGGDPAQVLPARLMKQGELLRLSDAPDKALEASKEIVRAALAFRDQHAFSRYGEILRKAQRYIDQNYHRAEITLHDVAQHVALSNNHFCTVFSQEMGVTFTEYLTNTRMAKAKALLATTDKRTSEVAYAVGYNDPHYFSYLFKKNVNLSPRDFRKEASR